MSESSSKKRSANERSASPNRKKIPKNQQITDITDDTPLLSFQKEAIWRQMREYKRLSKLKESECILLGKKLEELSKAHFFQEAVQKNWFKILEALSLEDLNSNINNHADSWRDFQAIEFSKEIVVQIAENIKGASNTKCEQLSDALTNLLESSIRDNSTLKSEIEFMKESLKAAEQRLDDTLEELRICNRKADRLQLDISKNPLKGETYSNTTPTPNPNVNNDNNGASMDASTSNDSKSSSNNRALENEIKELQVMLDNRLKELEEMRQENTKLHIELGQKAALNSTSDSNVDENLIVKSDIFQKVSTHNSQLREKIEQLNNTIAETEKRLDEANSGKKQLASMIQDIARKNQEDTKSLFEPLELEIKSAREELANSLATIEDLKAKVSNLSDQNEELVKLTSNYRERVSVAESVVENLQSRLKLADKQSTVVSDIEKRLEEMEQNEDELMNEIETIGKALDELTEQNEKLLKKIEEKEDSIAKLLSERLKLDQLKAAFSKEKELFQSHMSHVKSHELKFLELAKSSEQNEAKLRFDLTCMEKEMFSRQSLLDKTSRRLSELLSIKDDLMKSLEKSNGKVHDLQREAQSRVTEIQNFKYENKRLAEENRYLKKKVGVSGGSLKANMNDDFDELAAYKKLLYCNSCELRQKSVILTRCSHLFCKECIDTRIETRQRKCPNCSDAFGINDVKPIFL